MRCHICDSVLSETEVKFNKKHDEFDPCGTCLEIIDSVFEDTIPEEQMKKKQLDEEVEDLLDEAEEIVNDFNDL